MTISAQTSITIHASSSTDDFNFKDFYASQNSSAEKILSKVQDCLSCLENNFEKLNLSKEEYYKYVKYHWDISQHLYDSQEETAKKIQEMCQNLIYQGMVYKFFEKEISIRFLDSKEEFVKFKADETILMGLISPLFVDAFKYVCKEALNSSLSLNMTQNTFQNIIRMAKNHAISDEESINNILGMYENVNFLRIDSLRREIADYILSNIKDSAFENLLAVFNYFSSTVTYDSKKICESLLISIGEQNIQPTQVTEVNTVVGTAIQISLDQSKIKYLKSCVNTTIKDYVAALCDINAALETTSNDPGYLVQRAHINYMLSDYTAALQDVNSVLIQESGNLKALIIRGNIYRLQDEHANALKDIKKALQIDPDNVYALRSRGDVYRLEHMYEDALEDFNKALQIEPNHAFAFSSRGSVNMLLGKYPDALKDLNQALQIEPDNAVALVRRGILYDRLNKYRLATEDYVRALQIFPKHEYALQVRAFFTSKKGLCLDKYIF